MKVNTASGVNKGNSVPTSANITEVNLQVSLVSMCVLVPERDFSTIVAVGTELVQYEVRIDGRTQVVIAIVSGSEGPLQVGLMTMSVLVPTRNFGIVMSGSTKDMSNRAELTLNEEMFASVEEIKR